jgi:hypothetical protein
MTEMMVDDDGGNNVVGGSDGCDGGVEATAGKRTAKTTAEYKGAEDDRGQDGRRGGVGRNDGRENSRIDAGEEDGGALQGRRQKI